MQFSFRLIPALLLAAALGTPAAFAQGGERPENWEDNRWRWFEIEVLVVRYTDSVQRDSEVFPLQLNPVPVEGHRDLLTSTLYSSNIRSLLFALPQCADDSTWLPILDFMNSQDEAPASTDFLSCIPHKDIIIVDSWYGNWEPYLNFEIEQAPVQMTGPGGNIYTSDVPFLMPSTHLDMTGIRERLTRRPGVVPVLHTAWQQPVFARTTGRKTRLFGGRNFSNKFTYDGFPVSAFESQTSRIEETPGAEQSELRTIETVIQAIDEGQFSFRTDTATNTIPDRQPMPEGIPADVWEFDGLMHIYMVGNYLHIDGEFNLREQIKLPLKRSAPERQLQRWLHQQPEESEFLRGYYFKQLRRVISHQLHYFDHPEFGVLVEIRRTDLSGRR